MKVFDKMNWIPVFTGMTIFVLGCSGTDENGGAIVSVSEDNGLPARSTDSADQSGEDPRVREDDIENTEKDTGNVEPIHYPEPGTDEYWAEIIPGTWEEKPCVEFDFEDCKTELTVYEVNEKREKACSTSQYFIDPEESISALGGLCLEPDGSLSLCKNNSSCSFQAEGKMIEKIINQGSCSAKTDTGESRVCVRHSDCADLSPQPSCVGMKVEYWMEFCYWWVGDSCIEKGKRSFQKIL